MRLTQPIARRCLLAGASVAATCFGWPGHSWAETASDGFRVVRARPLGPGSAPQSPTFVSSYDGTVPGPTLRITRGKDLCVRVVNDLDEPTSVHWHGVRLPNAMDGVPGLTQAPIASGASFDYRFRPPDAGTFWYHAHIGAQVDRGLYAALIVEEAQPVDVDRGIVLMFSVPPGAGGSPAPVLVNGSLRPDVPVRSGERLRLRLINATTARGLSLKLEGHAPWVMAIDGQPTEPLLAREGRVGLGPGSRVDLFIDATREGGTVAPLVEGVRDEQPVARLVYQRGDEARAARRSAPLPLPPNPLPVGIDLKNSLKAELKLGNARPLDLTGTPLFTVRRSRAVTLGLHNPSGQLQVVHLHGHHFRLLDRLDDGWKPYWMDTLLVGDAIERVAFVADNPGKWLLEGRALERPDTETAAWFVVD